MTEEIWGLPIGGSFGVDGKFVCGAKEFRNWLEKLKIETDQLKEQFKDARAQSRVNDQHRMLYQTQRNELRETIQNMEAQEKAYMSCIDGLKEDAEKWRKLHREDPDATIDIYEEFDGAIEELNFLRDQLRGIAWACHQMNTIDASHKTNELAKLPKRVLRILGKEFERSDDSILSRYLAVKEWLIRAKAEGRISMNVGFSLGLVLGVEE